MDMSQSKATVEVMARLPVRQLHGLRSLLAGRSIVDTAKTCGVTKTIVLKWIHSESYPDFQRALRRAKEAIIRDMMARFPSTTFAAYERLSQILADDNAPYKVWIAAASTVIQAHFRFTEEIETRRVLEGLQKQAERLEALSAKPALIPVEVNGVPQELSDSPAE
jgi:hypothetical protein